MQCIFCRIISGEVPSQALYQDEQVIAIRDINPQAPSHILVLPRSHIPTVADLGLEQKELMGHLVHVANLIAEREGFASRGYRLVINCGPEGGQIVPHLHLHLLGGRQLDGQLG